MNNAWQQFVNEDKAIERIDPIIQRSWERSKGLGINHEKVINNEILPMPQLRERCQAQEDLVYAVKSVLPHIYNLLQNQNYVVLVSDSEGYILNSIGDPPFMSKAQQVYLSPGASWREETKGTNAIGTVLAENTPLRILGWEHFVKENHFLACWAAPIHNSKGQTVGVLDISGSVTKTPDRLLEVAIMGAKMIEQNMLLLELQRDFNFYRQGVHLAGEMLQNGFIAIDSKGTITEINQAGANLLGRTKADIIGTTASEVFSSTKGWSLTNESLDLKLREKTGKEVISRLRQVVDDDGKTMGAVGVLQPAKAEYPAEKQWVGRSPLTHQVFQRAAKVATTNSSILILGESGTGKEVVARHIHKCSTRREGPFIALNCAALPHSLVESELFGYADGAFTGARRGGHPGKFELANGGTIFLDEVGDMPLDVQVNLLRVLQEREVLRIGDSKPKKIDVRVIAATHKNLAAMVTGGLFRLDLFYRLKVVTIDLPPLRDRVEDILDLVPYLVQKACKALDKEPLYIDDNLYPYLTAHSWPGNIRELENCIEGMVAMSDGVMLTWEDLPPELRNDRRGLPTVAEPLLNQQTKQAIQQALKQTKGKIAPAARILGIGRNTLYRKIKELDIII
jgi:sigma-54 dependent transcriptional regulator, acetoin dehydrogenase operon transcriptional activator AcoR